MRLAAAVAALMHPCPRSAAATALDLLGAHYSRDLHRVCVALLRWVEARAALLWAGIYTLWVDGAAQRGQHF